MLQTQPSPQANAALLHQRIEWQVHTTLDSADDFVLRLRDDDVGDLENVELTLLMTEVCERRDQADSTGGDLARG